MKFILLENGIPCGSVDCASEELIKQYCGQGCDEDHYYDYRLATSDDQYPMPEHMSHVEIAHTVALYDDDFDYSDRQHHMRELGVFDDSVTVHNKNLSTVQLAHLIMNACEALQSSLYHQSCVQSENELLHLTADRVSELRISATRVSTCLTPPITKSKAK